MSTVPEPTATFPNVARIALGLLIGAVTYFINGDYIHIGESERLLISSVVVVLGSAGIVPPSPGDFRMSQAVSIVLTLVALVLNYLIVDVLVDNLVLQGILSAVVATAASIGIVPPQVRRI